MSDERLARTFKPRTPRIEGSSLVVVLWCIAVLSAIVYGVLYAGLLELRIAKNYADSEQARYLALAGIETAKYLIYQESRDRKTEGTNFRTRLYDDPQSFRGIKLGRGEFDVCRAPREGEGFVKKVYGIRDEEACLNVNTAAAEELAKLPEMTAAIAAAIVDWRDDDDELTPGGAEGEYYNGLEDPYRIRNAPLETLRELLGVRGVTEELLLGEDANANGVLDPAENDGRSSYPLDNSDGHLDAGWSAWLTAHSAVANVNARGKDRIDISSADAETLATIDGISEDVARGIVAYRERQSFETIGHLLDARAIDEQQQSPGEQASPSDRSAEGRSRESSRGGEVVVENGQGEVLVSADLFKGIADDITVQKERTLHGVVNVNTAPVEVLACLSGLGEELAWNIVSHRQGRGEFTSIGELLDVPGITADVFKAVCSRLTVRPGTYRIVAEGRVPSTRARRRVEVVVRKTSFDFDTLYYRETP